ncbi:MAG: DUF3861 domain-containing protein [Desulfopila sp.]
MTGFQYRISVQPIGPKAQGDKEGETLSFEVAQHDELLAIVERLRQRHDLAAGTAEPLGVGLKLFGEALRRNRDNPVVEPLLPHFRDFMTRLKGKEKNG